MKKRRKQLSRLKIVDEKQGQVEAVFATLNVVDSDGDVTVDGAFANGQKVRISAYNHASWGPGHLPVGKGEISVEGEEAIFRGKFFLDTQAGRETFTVVKELEDLGEWSYGFDVDEAERGRQDGEDVNYLKALTVHEVSPVILGAGVGTRTLSAKGKQLASDVAQGLYEAGNERWGGDRTYVYVDDYDPDAGWVVFGISGRDEYRLVRISYTRSADDGISLSGDEVEVDRTTDYRPKGEDAPPRRKLSEEIKGVTADVASLTDRLEAVVAERSEKGKSLGQESRTLADELQLKTDRLREVLASGAGTPEVDLGLDVELAHELSRFRR